MALFSSDGAARSRSPHKHTGCTVPPAPVCTGCWCLPVPWCRAAPAPCLRGREPRDALCSLLSADCTESSPVPAGGDGACGPSLPPSLLLQRRVLVSLLPGRPSCCFIHGDLVWLGCLEAWWCRGKGLAERCIGGKTMLFLLASLLKESPKNCFCCSPRRRKQHLY